MLIPFHTKSAFQYRYVSYVKLKQNNHPSYTTNKIIVECIVCLIFFFNKLIVIIIVVISSCHSLKKCSNYSNMKTHIDTCHTTHDQLWQFVDFL